MDALDDRPQLTHALMAQQNQNMVSKPGGAVMPQVIRSQYLSDPRTKLAEAMAAGAINGGPAYGGWAEALARAATAGVAGWNQRQVRKEYEEQGQQYQDAMQQTMQHFGSGELAAALAAASSNPALMQQFGPTLAEAAFAQRQPKEISSYSPGSLLMRGDEVVGQVPFKPEKPTQTDREIESLTSRGISRDLAEDIAYGNYGKIFRDSGCRRS